MRHSWRAGKVMVDRILGLVVEFARFFLFFGVVRAYERGVLLRFGRPVRDLEPGLFFHLPFAIDEPLTTTVTPRTTDVPAQTGVTKDGKEVTVSVLITWGVECPRVALLESPDSTEAMLDSAAGAVARWLARTDRDALHSRLPALKAAVARRAARWGVDVTEVALVNVAHSRSLRIFPYAPPAPPQT